MSLRQGVVEEPTCEISHIDCTHQFEGRDIAA